MNLLVIVDNVSLDEMFSGKYPPYNRELNKVFINICFSHPHI